MTKQNPLSNVSGASGMRAWRRPDTSGNPRLFLHLTATLLLAAPLLLMSITVHADTPEPPGAEAFFFQGGDQEPLTIGVLDLDANGVSDAEARAISERLRIWLGRTGVFEVIERNQMESIMNEIGFQVSGACDTDECVVQIGQVLGASKMVAGSVSKVGNLYTLQVRLIDIASSRIDHQEFKDVPGGIEEVLTTASQEVANALAARVSGQALTPPTDPGQPAVRTTAQIRIESTPPGATFTVDGVELGTGTTPATVEITEGTHEVVVRLSGFGMASQTIQVVAGGDRTVMIPLTEMRKGYLTVTSDPDRCQVFVDGNEAGTTPLTRFEVYEGAHQVELRRDGYDSKTQQVAITARQTNRVNMTLLRAGAAQLTFQNTLAGARLSITGDEERKAQLNSAQQSVPLPPGNYTLMVKAKGYTPWRQTVRLADGDNTPFTVVLKPKSRVVAGLLSVIPGMGQFYSGRGFMGVLMLAGVAGSAAATMSEQSIYDTVLEEYQLLQSQYSAATTSQQVQDLRSQLEAKHIELTGSRDSMNSTSMIMSIIWGVNMLDAFALMPRLKPIAGAGIQSNLDLGTKNGRLTLTLSVAFK